MNRRTYVAVVGTMASAGLAGCVGELGLGDDSENHDDANDGESDDGGNDENDDGDEPSGDVEHGAVLTVEAYMEAGIDEDLEAMSETMHTHHPFDPVEMAAEAEENEDVEFTFGTDRIDDYEVELADGGYEIDAIYDIPYVEFWFQKVDLESVLEGEDAALVTVETETTTAGETVTESETLIVLTEDGEWRVFLTYEESTELPDGEPVDDETYRVVDDLEFDADDEAVRVDLVDSIDSSIEEIVAYSKSHGQGSSVYEPEDSDDDYTIPATWFSSHFDPNGDEIVVTVIVGGEELVVHRETYEP